MTKGGARTHSGPSKDPTSLKSAAIGYTLTALPNGGYAGEVPDLTPFIPEPTLRHLTIWSELWATPQACMWSTQQFKWPQVARLALLRVLAEGECPATIFNEVLKLETKLGLNDEGLRYLGWAIAADETAAKRDEKKSAPATTARDRMKVVNGGDGA